MAGQMNSKVQGAQKVIGYEFNDPLVGWEAFQAAGSLIQAAGTRRFPNGNKSLALLDDAVLRAGLLVGWYRGGSARVVGSGLVTTAGSNANLAAVGRKSGLVAYINAAPGQYGPLADNTVADAVEAIIGAVFEDSDYNFTAVKRVMHTLGLI